MRYTPFSFSTNYYIDFIIIRLALNLYVIN
nr:MAG TPA: hypothetical protein [Caudoviricetes sp.]